MRVIEKIYWSYSFCGDENKVYILILMRGLYADGDRFIGHQETLWDCICSYMASDGIEIR